MSSTSKERDIERSALDSMAKVGSMTAESPAEDFVIVPGQPLPHGFVNRPCGTSGHYCLDRGKCYDPEWVQCMIRSTHDKQRNPQPFPLLGMTYLVPLDEWVDVPEGVFHSLEGAVETHHAYAATPGNISLGEPVEHKVISRRRFHYEIIKSA